MKSLTLESYCTIACVFSCSALNVHDALKTVLSFIMQNDYFYFISFLKRSPKTQTIESDSRIAKNEMTTSLLV